MRSASAVTDELNMYAAPAHYAGVLAMPGC
jgi:hypothetical protein